MDASIAAMFGEKGKKQDLFNLWLQHARDFGKVALELTRVNIQRQSAQAKTVTWSRAQLEQSGRYTPLDIDDLVARCTASKSYIDDPNFPGVERLRRYILVDEVSKKSLRAQEDSQALQSRGLVSASEALSLTGAGRI